MGIKLQFKYIDIFGVNIKLNFEKKTIHKTNCGAFATLILIVTMLALAYIFGIDIILKQNPIVVKSEYLLKGDTLNNVLGDSSKFAIGFIDSGSADYVQIGNYF